MGRLQLLFKFINDTSEQCSNYQALQNFIVLKGKREPCKLGEKSDQNRFFKINCRIVFAGDMLARLKNDSSDHK